jgi:MFS-type transporter involved in bile tolerance (Atg22 family)
VLSIKTVLLRLTKPVPARIAPKAVVVVAVVAVVLAAAAAAVAVVAADSTVAAAAVAAAVAVAVVVIAAAAVAVDLTADVAASRKATKLIENFTFLGPPSPEALFLFTWWDLRENRFPVGSLIR